MKKRLFKAKSLIKQIYSNLRDLNDKQKDQAAKALHSVSLGAGLTVGIKIVTDGKTNTAADNVIMVIAFLCAIIFALLAILVLNDKGGDK